MHVNCGECGWQYDSYKYLEQSSIRWPCYPNCTTGDCVESSQNLKCITSYRGYPFYDYKIEYYHWIPIKLSITGLEGQSNSITITWNPDNHINQYKIYWDTNPNITKTNSNFIDGISGTQFIHDNLISGTYYYSVVGVNNRGEEGPLSDIASTSLLPPSIYGILRSETDSGSTEVHVLNGADNFQSFLLHTETVLSETGTDGNWVFLVAPY